MAQLENIEAIEKRLWGAADTLRANSNFASNEYFLPVMGLIFLRHAYSRFLAVKDDIEANLPRRGGVPRELTKEDFSQKSSIFLQEKAQFDFLVSLPDSADRAKAIIEAMESIEKDYVNLKDVLPKNEYQELDNEVLADLLRILNPEELKNASGDIFGRIYEYFLTQFADQKAHDGGEFFTPVSLVSFIANVLEPESGIVLDPACGSGGMFVQSAHFVERMKANPAERLTFKGMEKNPNTIRLAKMNLAVHGLEGNIQKAITYYEDPHELHQKADYVLANPPFNVDEVDATKIMRDPRLPFGIPGVNKEKRVSNGNYLWISYFYSYLNEKGRAGFVMSSQASGAGNKEAEVRKKIIETGHVDVMAAIRSNFFYTRTVPCELWFFNKRKSEEYQDKVFMLDARNVYRQVTRKIYDFSPEQLQNLLSIILLYRGENQRYLDLVTGYIERTLTEAESCIGDQDESSRSESMLEAFQELAETMLNAIKPFLDSHPQDKHPAEIVNELKEAITCNNELVKDFIGVVNAEITTWGNASRDNGTLVKTTERLSALVQSSRILAKQIELVFKLSISLIDACEKDLKAKKDDLWINRDIAKVKRELDTVRQAAISRLKLIRYYRRQAGWLTERFPEGKFRDVEGLVKLVGREELAANDWSLTPGRYVGVAPEEVDEDFNFEETMRNIHTELDELNSEAAELARKIKENFEGLGI